MWLHGAAAPTERVSGVWEGVVTAWEVRLPWTRPPLTMNGRAHWAVRARTVREVRDTTRLLVSAARVPFLGSCGVVLTYDPPDRRRRDADNLTATLKACCDGIVDAGVVRDDTPDLMHKHMPVIGPVTPGGRLTLTITDLGGGS